MAGGAAAAGAAAAAMANAVKASGTIVQVDPEEFMKVLARAADALVVTATGGMFSTHYDYLMSYKGLAFYTQSKELLPLPAGVERVQAEKIWIPGV